MLGGLVTNIIKNKKTLNKLIPAGYSIKNQHDKENKSNKKSVVQNNYKEIGKAIQANKLSASEVVNAMKPGGFLDYTYLLSNKNDLKGFKRSFLTFSKTKDYNNLVDFLTDLQGKITDTETKKSIKQIIGLLKRSIEFKEAKKVLTKKDDSLLGNYRGLNKEEIQILRSITRASKQVSFKGCHTIDKLNNRFKKFAVDLLENIIQAKTFFDVGMYRIPEEWEKILTDVKKNNDFKFEFNTKPIKADYLKMTIYGHYIPPKIATIITSAITVLTNSKDKYKTYVDIIRNKESIEKEISDSFDQICKDIDDKEAYSTAERIRNLFSNDKKIYKYFRLSKISGYNKLKQAVANSNFSKMNDIIDEKSKKEALTTLTTFQEEIKNKNIELKLDDDDEDNQVVEKFNKFKEKFLQFEIPE